MDDFQADAMPIEPDPAYPAATLYGAQCADTDGRFKYRFTTMLSAEYRQHITVNLVTPATHKRPLPLRALRHSTQLIGLRLP